MAGSSATNASFVFGDLQGALGGGVSLKAAGLVAASAAGTAAYVGKGTFVAHMVVSAIETGTGDEMYTIDIEANTRNATTTWFRLVGYNLGAATATGRVTVDAAGTYVFGIVNPYDYQLRVYTEVVGTIATGINYTLDIYPMDRI